MSFPGWHGQVDKLKGAGDAALFVGCGGNQARIAELRLRSGADDCRRWRAGSGHARRCRRVCVSAKNLELRRFGARASRKQDLVFRGRFRRRTPMLKSTASCSIPTGDTGVSLDMSFTSGNGLANTGSWRSSVGAAARRVRFFGALSSTLPTTISGRLSPCFKPRFSRPALSARGRWPIDCHRRTGRRCGRADRLDRRERGSIQLHAQRQRSSHAAGDCQCTRGQIRAEPLHFNFSGDIPWYARITAVEPIRRRSGSCPKSFSPSSQDG